jgi:hypothetical protein
MKKAIKWIALSVLLLVIVVIGVVWFYLNSIVKHTVETQATASLNLPTTLGGANVSLLGGSFGLSDLQIASPPGFSADKMFKLGGVKLGVNYSDLKQKPIRVASINIDKPQLVIEQKGGKFNFQALVDQESKAPPAEEGEPIKLIINELTVNGAQVTIKPGIPGLDKDINIPIPSMSLKNIGTAEGNQNGVAIKEVVGQVVTALTAEASKSDALPPEVRQLLSLNVAQVAQKLQGEFNKQLGAISGDVNKALGDIAKDPSKAGESLKNVQENAKEAGKDLQKNLGGLLGGDKKKDEEKKKEEKK